MPYYQQVPYYHYGPGMDQAYVYYQDHTVYPPMGMGYPLMQPYAIPYPPGPEMHGSMLMIHSPPTPPPHFIAGSPQLQIMPFFGPGYKTTIIHPVAPITGSAPARQGSGDKAANSIPGKLADELQTLSVCQYQGND